MSLVLRLYTFITAHIAMHLHEHLLSRLCHLSKRLLCLPVCQLAFWYLREELLLMIGDLDTILLLIEFVPESLQFHLVLHLHLSSLDDTFLSDSIDFSAQDLTKLLYFNIAQGLRPLS